MKYGEKKFYRRGRDYPYYCGHVKMAIGMSGAEVKKWFIEAELAEYPKPNAYTGSLP